MPFFVLHGRVTNNMLIHLFLEDQYISLTMITIMIKLIFDSFTLLNNINTS